MVESNLVVGYTCQDHLLLDLDDCSHYKAFRIARMVQESYPDVGVALILHSSKWHYHVVYDSRLTWARILDISKSLAALGVVDADYVSIREFRHDLTLRISPKRGELRYRPSPEPVGLYGCDKYSFPKYGILRYLAVLGAFINLDMTAQTYERESTTNR